MPQMAPIMWLSAYISFTLTLLIMLTYLYYLSSKNINKKMLINKMEKPWSW